MTAPRRRARWMARVCAVGVLVAASSAALADKAGCELATGSSADKKKFNNHLIATFGGAAFKNPDEVRPTSVQATHVLTVRYGDNTLVGCQVHLRSYNGKLVGDTIRAHPGDTIYIRLVNALPSANNDHPQPGHGHAGDFSFNVTNLHTHGLHVSPEGNSDNVFLTIQPGGSQEYVIRIPDNHPAGTFWYHAHFHGATAIQLSSGMEGTLIIEGGTDAKGGLDSVPEIAAAAEKVFVLQQFSYGPDGDLEKFKEAIPDRRWKRLVTVNGQLVPTIVMRPGEVQRWRFIHAGVQEIINLAADEMKLNEISADGIALGRLVPWPVAKKNEEATNGLFLYPGYRSDVLVQAPPLDGQARKELFLHDARLDVTQSLVALSAARRLAAFRATMETASEILEQFDKPERVIARIVVEGEPVAMQLPQGASLADRVPSEMKPIEDAELTGKEQPINFTAEERICRADGSCAKCDSTANPASPDCQTQFMVDYKLFTPTDVRYLQLGKASLWRVTGDGQFPHPFHIHVNPFEVQRSEPGQNGVLVSRKVWKDTIALPTDGSELILKSRYTEFKGRFVLHCHILGHEDAGMMQSVEIVQ